MEGQRYEYEIQGTERVGNITQRVRIRRVAYNKEQASYLAQKENVSPTKITCLGPTEKSIESCL